jgi:twitching motility protein PilT
VIKTGFAAAVEQAQLVDELKDVLGPKHWDLLKRKGHTDTCVSHRTGHRLRINAFRAREGLSVAIRLIPAEVRSIRELKIPMSVGNLTAHHEGLVLIAGPKSSGKTTTMAALVQRMNALRRDHIITVEDPIEYIFKPNKCLISQRYIGVHTTTYAQALRSALREDPDVIIIGELHDNETIKMALSSAETGHLVVGTLHTQNAESTIARICDAFGDQEEEIRGMLAETLRGILVQQLVPTVDGTLQPVIELMLSNSAISNCIRQRKLHQLRSLIHSGKTAGMITMEDSINDLRTQNVITSQTAARMISLAKRGAAI